MITLVIKTYQLKSLDKPSLIKDIMGHYYFGTRLS